MTLRYLMLQCEPINYAEWTTAIGTVALAVATIALALFTLYLLITAKRELKHIQSGINIYAQAAKKNEELNQVNSAENTIMKQIEFHYKLVEGIKLSNPDGQRAFKNMYLALTEIYNAEPAHNNGMDGEKNRIKSAYKKLYETFGSDLGNYYKNLYFLIKYINGLDAAVGYKKDYYINLVKAQLSKYELLLLAYNCVWIYLTKPKMQGENFIEYVSIYNLLSSLETTHLMNDWHVQVFNDYHVTFDDQNRR